MKTIIRLLLMNIALSFYFISANAQFDPEKVCRIESDRLIFTLNLKWTEKEKKEIRTRFDLDSSLIEQAYKLKPVISYNNETWNVKKTDANRIELSKPLSAKTDNELKSSRLNRLIDSWMNFSGTKTELGIKFGVNNFESVNSFVYTGETARFFLGGNLSAQKIFLSGTFNNWSTSQNPMKKTERGWVVNLSLKPGKYAYKYIIDGKWTIDPGNKLRERGEAGSFNSVVYCHNHIFRLNGFRNSRKAVVTGNFCNWNPRGVPMNLTSVGWSLPVYIGEGTHSYKFIVDGKWMTDPENKDIRADANGNQNSFMSIGNPFLFKLNGFHTAEKVILTGTFNNWNRTELVMEKTAGGWQLPYVIPAGNYEYKFIADGKWMIDPANPFTSGTGETQNSFLALNANHVFELKKYVEAENVMVTGSFNGWNEKGYHMARENGKWIFPMHLKPGKYTYKYIVDGKWIIDPHNDLYEQNEYDTDNSVLWIEPF